MSAARMAKYPHLIFDIFTTYFATRLFSTFSRQERTMSAQL